MKAITTGFAVTALAASIAGLPDSYACNTGSVFIPPEKLYKPCLVCGEPHQHNNSFCSAECCKSYRKEGK